MQQYRDDGFPQQQQQQQPNMVQFVAVQPYSVSGQPPPPGQQFQFVQSQPMQEGAVVIGQVVPVPRNRFYRLKAAKVLGTMQIVLAILAAVCGTITIVVGARTAWIGIPIWGGLAFFLPAGILAVVSRKPTNMQSCVINSCLVMSIFSMMVASSMVVMSCIVASQEVVVDENGVEKPDTAKVCYWAMTALVGLVEFFVSIVQCVYCCRGRGCCRPSDQEIMQFAPQHRHLTQPNQNMPQYMAYPALQPAQLMQQQQQFQQYHMASTGSQRVRNVYNDITPGRDNSTFEKEKEEVSDDDDGIAL